MLSNGFVPVPSPKVYATKNCDNEQRSRSSSGGLFIALAEQVIKEGGVVFGAVFDEKWEAHHVSAMNLEDLLPMMRSKYFQSRTENTFTEVERYLKQGRKVMYVGTSCQIAGLRRFLRKDYENLLAVDLICHGVPSPRVWKKYLEEVARNLSLNSLSSIGDISFREKSRSGFDWKRFGFVIWKKPNSATETPLVLSSSALDENPFMRGFLSDLYLRPSCYVCPFKGGKSGSDITIADFWGIESVFPDFYDAEGVGLAILHTGKGEQTFNKVPFQTLDTTLEKATSSNSAYWMPKQMPARRKRFFGLFKKGKSVEQSVSRCLKPTFMERVVERISGVKRKVIAVTSICQ